MSELVKVTLHGVLGEEIGSTWSLAVNSVSEAIHAIEMNSGHNLYKTLLENDKKNIQYRVLVNQKAIVTDKLSTQEPDKIRNSELCINKKDIETIDIVPVLEGADFESPWMGIFLGGILMLAGLGMLGFAANGMLLMAGLGLVFQGVANLLSTPPKFEDFRDIEQNSLNKRASYLFSGPVNTVNEGGPIPILYGRLFIGSQVIGSSYDLSYKKASEAGSTNTG
jgi:predicted phage tail protein